MSGIDQVGFGSDEAVYADQARSIADGTFAVRAHPPLWMAAAASLGDAASDTALRRLSVAAGVATVVATAAVAASAPIPARRASAVLAAWVVALMPYHILVSRQFLLDGPAALSVTCVVLATLRWERTGRVGWLMTLGVAAASATLVKESSLLVVAALLALSFARPTTRRTAAAVVAGGSAAASVGLWLALATLVGQGDRLGLYAQWQVGRSASTGWGFYGDIVAPDVGIPVLVAGAVGAAWLMRRGRGGLILIWVSLPLLALQLWPVKSYSYLAIIVPAVAVLASTGIVVAVAAVRSHRFVTAALLAGLAAPGPLAMAQDAPPAMGSMPGRDGLPAVREAAEWVSAQPGAVVTASPAVANVIGYYADVDVAVVGEVTDDRHINPAYRTRAERVPSQATYFVWDAWTAIEHPADAASVLAQARADGARVAFVGSADAADRGGSRPLVVVFERP